MKIIVDFLQFCLNESENASQAGETVHVILDPDTVTA